MNSTPPKKWVTVALLLFFTALCVVLIAAIATNWPPARGLFFRRFNLNPEQQLIILVAVAGALGAFIHVATSFTDYLGSQKFERSWIPWYLMRPFIGSALALAFYFLLRGGLINVNAASDEAAAQYALPADTVIYLHYDTVQKTVLRSTAPAIDGFKKIAEEKIPAKPGPVPPVNPFGITAVSLLAGLFSRQAVDKLREIFENLFLTKEKVERANPLVETDAAKKNTTDTAITKEDAADDEPVG